MFSRCLCWGSRTDLSYEYLRLFVPFFSSFCSRSSPRLLCLCGPPHLACLAVCSPVSKLLHVGGRAVWLAVLQSFPPPLLYAPPVPHRHSEPCGCAGSISRQELKWVTVPPGLEHRQEGLRESRILLGRAAVAVTKLWWIRNTDIQCREGKCQLLLRFI